jgi:hypothetical protein
MFNKIKKIIKRIKKFFKRLCKKIIFKINPSSLSKKDRKKFRKEKEISDQYSWWGNFLRKITGCNNLKINAYA